MILKRGKLDPAQLVAGIRLVNEQVVRDIGEHAARIISKPCKPLKLPKRARTNATPNVVLLDDDNDDASPPDKRVKKEEVKEEVKDEPLDDAEQVDVGVKAPDLFIEAEAFLDKAALMDFHGMKMLPRDPVGKLYPAYCKYCDQTISAKGRAKVWQHVRGQEHRAKKFKAEQMPPEEIKTEPADHVTKVIDIGFCKGLRLNGSIGKQTRLGDDLRATWDEFVKFSELGNANAPRGVKVHDIQEHHARNDWTIRHQQCVATDSEKKQVRRNDEGDVTCSVCYNLCSDAKWISRIAALILDMDQGRLLWHRTFASDKVEEFQDSIKKKELYLRRCQSAYDTMFAHDDQTLYTKVRNCWNGRRGLSGLVKFILF